MKKKVAIIFLGDFFYDARIINMALSLKKNHNVSIICTFKEKIIHQEFENITFHKITI